MAFLRGAVTYVCAVLIALGYVALGAQLFIWHRRDMKPQDIQREPYNRRTDDAWTNQAFRAQVIAFIKTYVEGRGWAEAWDITERFTSSNPGSSPRSVNVRTRRGPALLFDNTPEEQFKQRDGVRLLVFGVTRVAKAAFGGAKRFEVSVHFPLGILTPAPELNTLLARVAESLDAAYRKDRGIT